MDRMSSSSSSSSSSDRELHNDARYNDNSSFASPIGSPTISGPYRVGNSDGDVCSYHPLPEGESCRQPRTCYECLNLDVEGMSDGCLLAPSGFCESMSSYEKNLDFRRNTTGEDLSITGWYNYFPSGNTTYCESTDEACVLCDKLVNDGSLGRSKTGNVSTEVERQLCRGTDGCVCIMACESDHWKANMPVACDTNRNALDNSDASSTDVATYSSMLIFCLVLQVVLLAVFMYKRGLCQGTVRPPPPRPEGPYNNVDAITSPSNRLRLSGWRKMQNTLIERETKQRTVQEPQYMASPRVEAAGSLTEASTQMQPLSPQNSARNSETEEVVYTQVLDDPSRQGNNSLYNTRQASVGSDGVAAERIAGTRTERTSLDAMLDAQRNVT